MKNRTISPTEPLLVSSQVSEPPARNLQTQASHRRETFWQVTFPFLILLLVFLLLVIGVSWAAVNGSAEVSRWADVALIWQLPLPIIFSLICLVANIGMAFGLIKLIGVLPGFFYKGHNYLLLIQNKVNQISDQIVEPVLRTSSLQARIQAGARFFHRR